MKLIKKEEELDTLQNIHCKLCEYDFLYLLTFRNLDLYHTLRLMVNGRTLQERRWGLKVLFPLYLSSNSRNQLFLPLTQGTDSSILPTSTPDPLHQEQRAIRTGHFHAIVPYLTKKLEAKVGWGKWLLVSISWFCSIQHNALSLSAMIFFHNHFLSSYLIFVTDAMDSVRVNFFWPV